MKTHAKRISVWLALVILASTSLSVPADSTDQAPENLREIPAADYADEYLPYAESDTLELQVNEKQCLLCLTDARDGSTWPLTPEHIEDDTLAAANTAADMRAHLLIQYCADDGVDMTMNSYTDCVAKGQYRLYSLNNGVRVEYTLGTPADLRRVLPLRMRVEDYEDITAFYADNDKVLRRLDYFYSRVSLDNASGEARRQELLSQYPSLNKGDLYVTRNVTEKERKELEGYFTDAGFTLERVDRIYEKLGYTEKKDNKPSFTIPVEYTLENGTFAATVVASDIVCNEDYYLETITLLPYFGARRHETGYVFIPDGCGSLVRFGPDRHTDTLYMTGKVYGDDISVEQTAETIVYRLPVFGIKGENSALFANITSGAANAQITAQSGNIINEYDAAYAVFTYHDKFVYVLSNSNVEQKNWPVFADHSNTVPYRVEYTLLTGDQADVAGMAAVYRQYLFADREKAAAAGTTLYLKTLGQINEARNFLGISYNTDKALTTFDDIRKMTEELHSAGVASVSVQMTGWYNGGLNYTAPSKIKVSKVIGGKSGLSDLLKTAAADDTLRLFPGFDLGFVMRTAAFDGFSSVKDTSRTIEGKVSAKRATDLALNKLGDIGRMVINPASALRYADKARAFLEKNGGGNIALIGIGSDVYGSYQKSNYILREDAVMRYTELLKKQAAQGDVMVEYGNAYALPWVTDVLTVPTDNSRFPDYGERVAFLQMVLRGYVHYAAEAVNLSEDTDRQLLRCVETGAFPYFVVAGQNVYSLRSDPYYHRYYAVNYDILADTITESYRKVAEVLDRVAGCGIVLHEQSAKDVFRTVYDNGVTVLVNYASTDYTDALSGKTVPAGGWTVIGEGGDGHDAQ